jgi:CRP-like cAMP-binding protein
MGARSKSGASTFDAQAFLDSAGAAREVAAYRRSEAIFSQGDAGDSLFYIQAGGVKLSAVSAAGREAVVAMLGPGDFFGEGGLAGQSVRRTTATALTPTTALVIGKAEMIRLLRAEHALSDRFIAYMLSRNIRNPADALGGGTRRHARVHARAHQCRPGEVHAAGVRPGGARGPRDQYLPVERRAPRLRAPGPD